MYSIHLPFGPFGNVRRLSNRPILSPRGSGFESAGTFNPAVVKTGGEFVMLYRAQDQRGTSTLGYATSHDGIHFARRSRPVLRPEAPYEQGGGCEDPRLARFGEKWVLTYTGYHSVNGKGSTGKDAQLCLATSNDLLHWERQGVIMPAYRGKWNIGWTKSGAIVPAEIGGKYWMYYLGDARGHASQMGLASSGNLLHWKDALNEPVLRSRPGFFDSQVTEPGPPPVILPTGIFLIYNGANDRLVYSTGWALFDRHNPGRLLARAKTPICRPEMTWEKAGQTPNVVFVEGLVRQGTKWMFYYGAADKYVGVAEAVSES
jgi:predicted GH43/DUF377 family glycosyl hydrolase